ncbi:MAG: tetratricopeptide repeat protein [Woeseia sp.]
MRDQFLEGFRLGSLRIDPLTGTVADNGASRHIPSKATEILLVLASRPRQLVTREELLATVWGEGSGSAEALSHAVSELRHGLGDHADHPEFVQTVPRRGYRLIVEPRFDAGTEASAADEPLAGDAPAFWQQLMHRGVVQAAAAHLVAGWLLIQVADATFPNLGLPAWATPFVTYVVIAGFPLVLVLAWFLEFTGGRMTIDRGGERGRSGLVQNYLAIVAAYALATLAVGLYQASVGIRMPQTSVTATLDNMREAIPVEPGSIAVLRFLNISDSPLARIFSDGLGEDVLDRLARVPGLLVSSRGDAWSLPDNPGTDVVRRRLRVAYYLEGSVRLTDDVLRVTVQLIDTETGFHVVSRVFERKLESFMDVQREITDLTVANLRAVLPAGSRQPVADYDVTTPDAYVLYRMGREIFERPQTVESLADAIDYFDQALDLDPGFAPAHAGMCRGYVQSYTVGGDPSFIDAAEASCSSALTSNPNLYMVYTALGDLYRQTSRIAQAENAYLHALGKNDQDVDALLGLARVLVRQNRIDEAEDRLKQAIHMQPGNWTSINALGSFYFATGDYDQAADSFRKVVYLDPANWQAHGNLGSALAMAGRFDDAAAALQNSIDISPQQTTLSNLGAIFYYMGDFTEAVRIHRQALDLDPNSNIVWLNLADALYFAGDEGAAQEAFARAAELSESRLAVNSGDVESLHALAWAQMMAGNGKQARELVDRTLSISPNDPFVYYYDALVRVRSGDLPGAFGSIEKAIAAGYPRSMLAAEPYLASIRGQERFTALLAIGPATAARQ